MRLVRGGVDTCSALIRRLPWWVSLCLGLACVVLGAVLIVNPFRSLALLIVLLAGGLVLNGCAGLLDREPSIQSTLVGAGLIAAGLLVALLPSWTITGLMVLIALALIVSGVANVIRAVRGTTELPASEVMLGLASAILGVLALSWPDVSVFVIAALFGARLLLFGVRHAWSAVRLRPNGPVSRVRSFDRESGRARRGGMRQIVGAAAALVLAVAGVLVSRQLSAAPSIDEFYTFAGDLPSEPGRLIRAEPFDRSLPENASGWRILYTTTTHDGSPALASGLVVVPDNGADHPAIAWAHGTTGFDRSCAPSLLEDPFLAGALPDLAGALEQGWAVVATDYAGLGTEGVQPYLIGQGQGRSVLDSVRAAGELADARLGERTVIWGHSQGGHAALWAGGIAHSYAPELKIAGVAALAPASNLPVLLADLSDSPLGRLFAAFALAAYAGSYPDVHVEDYVRPAARIMVESMKKRCLSSPSTIVSVVTSILGGPSLWSSDPGTGPLANRAEQNVPTNLVSPPLLIAQGTADTLITPTSQDEYVAARCEDGQIVDYRRYQGEDHLSIIADRSPLLPELHAWTHARLEGQAGLNTCG